MANALMDAVAPGAAFHNKKNEYSSDAVFQQRRPDGVYRMVQLLAHYGLLEKVSAYTVSCHCSYHVSCLFVPTS